MLHGRAKKFGASAHTYDRYRVAPAPEALDWLLPDGCARALDLGAGTGLLTKQLLERVGEVLAVDPDPRMLAVLRETCTPAGVLEGAAEDIPLPNNRVDAVFVSAAWHWVDPQRALPEIARVLEPGGILGLVWARWDRRTPWVEELDQELIHKLTGQDAVYEALLRTHEVGPIPAGTPFDVEDSRVISTSTRLTRYEMAKLYTTYSWYIQQPENRRQELWDAITERLALLDEVVDMPVASHCWRIRYRG